MVFTRDAQAIITSVGGGIVELLGWTADQLVGMPSTAFVHPEDQPSAIGAWMEMLTVPGSTRLWRGRYRSAEGAWRWVETVNENHLHEPGEYVRSTMTPVTVDQVDPLFRTMVPNSPTFRLRKSTGPQPSGDWMTSKSRRTWPKIVLGSVSLRTSREGRPET